MLIVPKRNIAVWTSTVNMSATAGAGPRLEGRRHGGVRAAAPLQPAEPTAALAGERETVSSAAGVGSSALVAAAAEGGILLDAAVLWAALWPASAVEEEDDLR